MWNFRPVVMKTSTLTSLKQTDELLVEGISEQSIGYLNVCCGLKSINLNDLVAVLI